MLDAKERQTVIDKARLVEELAQTIRHDARAGSLDPRLYDQLLRKAAEVWSFSCGSRRKKVKDYDHNETPS